MPRFFCDAIAGGKAVITGEDAAHIARSLRMQPGERLTLSDGQGTDFDCVLDLVTPQEVFLTVEESYPCRTEPSVYVRLYMAMPKAEKLELIVQKAVELGVGEIVPDPKSFEKKRVRLARIAAEAAKQSGRGRIPQVREMMELRPALEEMAARPGAMLFYERSTAPMQEVLDRIGDEASILIGAEGGFDESEVERALALGIPSLTLGPRILRCETAPMAALSVLMYHTGNLN